MQPPTESADLGWTSASDIRENYLVIGLAESGKTRDLLSIPGILPENQIDLRLKLKSLTPGAALPTPSSPGAVVVVDHFEFNLNDPDANLIRLNLMEHLLYETECRILLVSSVDPLFFFTEGAPGVITNSSDAELSRRLLDRWARVLCNFQKVRVGSGRDVEFIRRVHQFIRQHKDHRKFALLVKKECNATARLRRIGVDILDNFNDKIPLTRNLLISLVLDRAAEYYRVLWSGLTSSERLVLYQLALDGWANPKNTAALQQLESKLLICRIAYVPHYEYELSPVCWLLRTHQRNRGMGKTTEAEHVARRTADAGGPILTPRGLVASFAGRPLARGNGLRSRYRDAGYGSIDSLYQV